MKKTVSHFIAYLICLFVIAIACSKKKSEDSVCKTCKALATVDRPGATQQVCTAEAEGEFRASHSGQEITCQ
jgi:hypothetical protein